MQQKLIQWQHNIISKKQSKINLENNLRDNYFHLNLNVGPIMNNSRGAPIIINNNNNSNNNINNSNLNNSNINNSCFNNNNMNISNLNIEEELANKIKDNNINRNNKNNTLKNNYGAIYNSSSDYSTTQKIKQRPYSSEAPKRNKNYIPIDNKAKNNLLYKKLQNQKVSEKIVNKFIKRQEKYLKNNSQNKQKIIRDNEEEYQLIYTFEPKVNESLRKLYKKDKLPVSKRLYNDSIVRQNKIYDKQINITNTSKIIFGKSFNKNKYIELYEDSKARKEKQEELIKKVEKECGYTYAPSLLHKNYNSKKDKKNKKDDYQKLLENKSFRERKNNNNEIKKIKKIHKTNSCSKLVTLKKKEIKKRVDNKKDKNIINGKIK